MLFMSDKLIKKTTGAFIHSLGQGGQLACASSTSPIWLSTNQNEVFYVFVCNLTYTFFFQIFDF